MHISHESGNLLDKFAIQTTRRLSLFFWSLSQAFLIALTSDFIPRMYYLIVESPIYTFEGYVNSTLAVFNTSDWGNPTNTTSRKNRELDWENWKNLQVHVHSSYKIPGYFGPDPQVTGNFSYATCRYKSYRCSNKFNVLRVQWLNVFEYRLEIRPEAQMNTNSA